MTVSNISSTANACQNSATDGFGQLFKDFKGIGSAIQSGDLSSAQSALTTFQSDLQSNTGKNPLSQLFSNNDSLNKDLAALQTAVQSNDPAAAKDALKTLMQDMKSAMKTQFQIMIVATLLRVTSSVTYAAYSPHTSGRMKNSRIPCIPSG